MVHTFIILLSFSGELVLFFFLFTKKKEESLLYCCSLLVIYLILHLLLLKEKEWRIKHAQTFNLPVQQFSFLVQTCQVPFFVSLFSATIFALIFQFPLLKERGWGEASLRRRF